MKDLCPEHQECHDEWQKTDLFDQARRERALAIIRQNCKKGSNCGDRNGDLERLDQDARSR